MRAPPAEFAGRACVAYLPGDRILGLSKLARLVEHSACRPQTQERLTKQVADSLQEHLDPRAVGVVMAAEHSCMTLRGVRATGSSTVTSALLGELRSDPALPAGIPVPGGSRPVTRSGDGARNCRRYLLGSSTG